MDRFTISLDESLAHAFDELIKERGYATRSEAVRDILRTHLQTSAEKRDTRGACVANLSYVYNHHERELSERLTSIQHEHHDLTVSTMHAHLDHDQCIETVMLKGPVKRVREFAEEIIAERRSPPRTFEFGERRTQRSAQSRRSHTSTFEASALSAQWRNRQV